LVSSFEFVVGLLLLIATAARFGFVYLLNYFAATLITGLPT